MIGETTKDTLSAYQPSEEIIGFTKQVRDDYQIGMDIIQKPWVELNDRSVIEDQNRGQMMFNGYVDTSVEDPDEAWKWRGTRSMARNKGIAMHAQLTASYLLPLFVAQNEDDEVDRDFSEVMRDIIEWMAQPINSDYQSSFLQIVFGMETNPVTFMGAEYSEVYQKIKEKTKNGYEVKEVLDEVLSGFKAPLWSANQVLITNAYERNIQKQRAIIKRRYCEYQELEAKYGEHENWSYVQEGIKSIYNDEDGLFYDIKDDDDHQRLVAEEIYLDRRNDTEVCFVNGVYMGESDIENNPIKHRDNRNTPKYNVIPFGFHRIGEHFFYYKSMMNSLGWDNMLYDAMSEVVMNRALLEVEMPIAMTGVDGQVDSSVIFPNSVVALENKDARITPLLPGSNMVGGFNALQATAQSMDEGSAISKTMEGQLPEASQKAYSVAQANTAAKRMVGAVGKPLAESIVMYGDLMKDIVLNHITVPQVDELTGGKMKMKYKTFLLENKKAGKKMADSVIKFDESLIGAEMTEAEQKTARMRLLEESGYPKETKSIRLVNPEMFAKFKYLTKVDIEEMFTKGNDYWQPILLALKAQLANDPFVDQENLTRKILYSYFNAEGEDLMKEEQIPGIPNMPGMPGATGQPGTSLPNQALNKATAEAVKTNI